MGLEMTLVARGVSKVRGKVVEGILLPKLKRFNNKSFIMTPYTRMEDMSSTIEVILSTVEVSFDGTDWISLAELGNIIKEDR